MGQSIACLRSRFFNRITVRVFIDGLDGAGKTTIIYRWIYQKTVETFHTIGFNSESLEYNDYCFTFWDFGSSDKLRPVVRHYYSQLQATVLIFVVDSADAERFPEVKDELSSLLQHDAFKDAVLLILANKQDLPNALTAGDLTEKLGIDSLQNRQWRIQNSCAKTGDGLYEGLDWLCKELSKSQAFK